MPDRWVGAACQVAGKPGRWVHLIAVSPALRVRPRSTPAAASPKAAASRWQRSAQPDENMPARLDIDALPGGVAIVAGAGADLAGQDGLPDADTPVATGKDLLEPGRAAADVVAAGFVVPTSLARGRLERR
jgi:hypothetical protein